MVDGNRPLTPYDGGAQRPARTSSSPRVRVAALVTTRRCRLSGVGIWGGEVEAPGRSGPPHDSRPGLVELPALGLFAAMVMAAERGQVALAGQAALIVGNGVVEVTPRGRSLAAGRAAGGGASPDQMLKLAAGLVARLLVTMTASLPGQWRDGDAETW